MEPLASWLDDQEGSAGPAVLLGLVGAAVGAPLGFITGGVLAQALVCNGGDGSLGAGESCGMSAAVFTFLGLPIGALVGAIVGAFVGARHPRPSVEPLAVGPDGEPGPTGSVGVAEPPVHREVSIASWLAVAGGLAIAFGAFSGWRSVSIPYDQLARYGNVLTPGPEAFGFLGGLIVLFGGTIRVLRPAAPAPTALIGMGSGLALVGVVWGIVDLLGVPAILTRYLFVGFWISLAGIGLAIAGWFVDSRMGRE